MLFFLVFCAGSGNQEKVRRIVTKEKPINLKGKKKFHFSFICVDKMQGSCKV